MGTGKTGVEDFSRTLRQFGKRLQKSKGSLALNQKLKGIDHSGLNAIKKKEIKESLSLLDKNETKD
jgi:L-2-hydroxyglutarate oxidase LhgO